MDIAGPTAQDLIQIDGIDDVIVGNTNNPIIVKGDAVDAFQYDYGGGAVDVWHYGNMKLVTSGEIALPVASASWAHTLSAIPLIIMAVLRCKNVDAGWAVGDEVFAAADMLQYSLAAAGVNEGFTIGADATDVHIIGDTGDEEPYIRHKTTGVPTQVDAAKWKIVIRAFGAA
jgi:hypothetical protein